MSNTNARQSTGFLILAWVGLIEGGFALAYLLLLPSDSKSSVFMGFSSSRWVLVGSILTLIAIHCVSLYLSIKQQYYKRIVSFLSSTNVFAASLLLWLFFILILIILWMNQDLRTHFFRLSPLMVYSCLIFMQISILHLVLIRDNVQDGFSQFVLQKMEEIGVVFKKPEYCLGITLILGFPILFLNAIKYQMPLGYAGMFTLMAEEIASSGFRLPMVVPFYGPGGVPFAYPPLGLYLLAFAIKIGVPVYGILRFIPPLFSLFALIPIFFLTLEISGSKIAAMVSAVLVSISSYLYEAHTWAAGSVRGLAFILVLFSIYYYVKACNGFRKREAILSGVFLGLATLTHLSYTILFIVWMVAWLLTHPKKNCLWASLIVSLIGLLISIPWMIIMIDRYGFSVFRNATLSHGNDSYYSIFQNISTVLEYLQNKLGSVLPNPIYSSFVLGGIIYLLITRQPGLPVVFLGVALFIFESHQYLTFVNGVIAGIFISWIIRTINTLHGKPIVKYFRVVSPLIMIGLSASIYLDGFQIILYHRPVLNTLAFDVAQYVRENTPTNARYLLVAQQDEAEWFPYLLEREPLIGQWGSEWLGDYYQQTSYLRRLRRCEIDQDIDCISQLISIIGDKPDYLITLKVRKHLNEALDSSSDWKRVYRNSRYLVWRSEE